MNADSVLRALLFGAGVGLAAIVVLTAAFYAAGVRGMGLVVPSLIVAVAASLVPVRAAWRSDRT